MRPISLTDIFAKIAERFVAERVVQDIENNIDGSQFGDVLDVSTSHYLVSLQHYLHQVSDKSYNIGTVVPMANSLEVAPTSPNNVRPLTDSLKAPFPTTLACLIPPSLPSCWLLRCPIFGVVIGFLFCLPLLIFFAAYILYFCVCLYEAIRPLGCDVMLIKSYHIISYHIISYHIISYHIISYHIISYQPDNTRNQFDMYSFVSQSWCAFWQKNDMLLKWSILKSTSEPKPQRKAYHLKDTALLCDF